MIPICILAIEDESDRAFMEHLFLQYHRLMYHEILKITKDPYATDDILQNVLVKLINQIQKMRQLDRDRLVNYIITASKNTALNHIRPKKYGLDFSFDECIDFSDKINDGNAIENLIIHEEEMDSLTRIWPKLDERSRYLLENRYLLEKTNEEIAKELNIKPSSVRMALTRAKKNAAHLLNSETNT